MNDKNTNPISNKIFINGILTLQSPITIGSGDDNFTDNDLIRNGLNEVIIPGTSIAGTIRSYLSYIYEDKYESFIREMFGFQEGKKGCQSNLIFYDSEPFSNDYNISIRDGIKIGTKENNYIFKNTQERGKYDYEIIESGARFHFKLEVNLWQSQREELSKLENLLYIILNILKNGELRFGGKTTRGFGKVKLNNIKILKLDLSNENDVSKWINFNWNDFEGTTKLKELNNNVLIPKEKKITTIDVNFQIPYSILIGEYIPDPGEADIIHIQENGKSIIPGTSWNGALRSAIFQIFREIKKILIREEKINISNDDIYDNIYNGLIESLFGYVSIDKDESNQKSEKSKIIIDQSEIVNRKVLMNYTHNKIDRFTGGAVDKALFTDCASYGGRTNFHISLKECEDYEIGIILLGLKELMNGFQTVGGTTAIGRGILESKEIKINDELLEEDKFKYYCNEMMKKIMIKIRRDQNDK
ncbi:MAG: RAMP superfamily CRISPR-associated protein [Candidatus Lokiarchaeota archaeon]